MNRDNVMKKSDMFKNYTVYTGMNTLSVVLFWLAFAICFVLLIVFVSSGEDFIMQKNISMVSVCSAILLITSMQRSTLLKMLKKTDCYLLCIKNRFEAYKSFHYVNLTFNCLQIFVVSLIVYLVGTYKTGYNQPIFWKCLADFSGGIFALALSLLIKRDIKLRSLLFGHFIFTLSLVSGIMIVNNLNPLISAIVWCVSTPVLMYFANHRWLKIVKSVYDDVDEPATQKTSGGEK